jgi:hypothetical protein
VAEDRAADHEPDEQPQMLWAIFCRAQSLARYAWQVQDRRSVTLPFQSRNCAAESGAQPDRGTLSAREIVGAKGEQVRQRATEGWEQRQEIAARVAPEHSLGRRLNPAIIVGSLAQRPNQGHERSRHLAAAARAPRAARFSASVV